MKRIGIFELENDIIISYNIKVRLTPTSWKYELNKAYSINKVWNDMSDQIKNSCVGSSNGYNVDISVRKSKYVDVNLEISYFDELKKSIQQICPEYLHECINYKINNFKLIKYETGGKFKRHTDTLINEYHFGTLLVFPPIDDKEHGNVHEGGNLELIPFSEDSKLTVVSSSIKKWTFVFFNPLIEHECLEITNGNRYVFKTELFYQEEKFKLMNEIKQQEILPVELPIRQKNILYPVYDQDEIMKNLKNELINKLSDELENCNNVDDILSLLSSDNYGENKDSKMIVKFKNSINAVQKKYYHNDKKIYEIINEINPKNKINIIVLKTWYPILNCDTLYDDDYELFRQIRRIYPKSYLINRKSLKIWATSDIYDIEEFEFNNSLEFRIESEEFDKLYEEFNGTYYYKDRYIIYCAKNIIDCGEIVSTKAEYNDSTYDHVAKSNVSCIYVITE